MPAYARTDARVTFEVRDWLEVYGEIINIFNRENFHPGDLPGAQRQSWAIRSGERPPKAPQLRCSREVLTRTRKTGQNRCMTFLPGTARARGLTVVLLAAGWNQASAQRAPTVAAASDLSFALTEIADRFAAQDGRVELVFGSSGNLTRQIRDGAPFELFLSADEAFVESLADAGLRAMGTLYAVGGSCCSLPRVLR